jgi:putative phosphoribosyl transferase
LVIDRPSPRIQQAHSALPIVDRVSAFGCLRAIAQLKNLNLFEFFYSQNNQKQQLAPLSTSKNSHRRAIAKLDTACGDCLTVTVRGEKDDIRASAATMQEERNFMLFRNRTEAGQQLANKLRNYANQPDAIVLGLPRGGIPVAYEVAKALNLPLDVFLVRKLGTPSHEELAMGAIASGGARVLNDEVVQSLRISEAAIEEEAQKEKQELDRREKAYRGDRPPLDVSDRTVILVDDGLATGSTMHAAAIALREQNPKQIVAAVPVSAPETCQEYKVEVDKIICAETPRPFRAVGLWYDQFPQTTDDEVRDLLQRAAQEQPAGSPQ